MVNYLVINCGYTSRFVRNGNIKDMKHKPVFIWDSLWGKGLYHISGKTSKDYTYEAIQDLVPHFPVGHDLTQGTIVFRYDDDSDEFDIIETIKELQGFNHCAFFVIDNDYDFDMEETEAEEEGTREMITNEMLDKFNDKETKKKYYYGTLYKFRLIKSGENTIRYMQFDRVWISNE